MLSDFIISRIRAELPFVPNEEKEELFGVLGQWLVSIEERRVFILRGYAGTGKTSVVSALVRALEKLNQRTVLMAPTGRAAKVLSRYANRPAHTIHKCIYRQNQLGAEAFSLSDNLHRHTLFIIDEASMISATRDNPTFGSGSLLDDLVRYVYSGLDCRMIVLGDDAQLPPVGSLASPALSADHMAGYGLSVSEFTLRQVARQALDSQILSEATRLRSLLDHPYDIDLSQLEITPGGDIIRLAGEQVVDTLEQSYRERGEEETIILTRTNRRTNLYNQGVRARILWREELLSNGDRLMVTKNNYHWCKDYDDLDFLANGDILQVERQWGEHEMYGHRFVHASLRSVDYDWEIDTMVWLDTLTTDSPEEHYQMQRTLFGRIAEDYPEVRNRKELTRLVYETPYYNALQVRHAYAVTCHKAQGGQWQHVYIDPGNIVQDEERMADPEERISYLRWLYTALTRAQERVYLLG